MKRAWPIAIAILSLSLGALGGWIAGRSGDDRGAVDEGRSASHPPAEEDPALSRLRQENDDLRRQIEAFSGLSQRLETSFAGQLAELEQRLGERDSRLRGELNAMAQAVAQTLLADDAKFNRYIAEGIKLQEQRDFSGAVAEFSKAIAVKPDVFAGYINRGVAYQDMEQWALALSDLQTAKQLAPDNFTPWNNIAWILATCPDERFRDGPRAVKEAEKACELSEWENYAALSTLAAAHAEVGEFAQAIKRIEQSVESSPEEIRPQLLAMFESFKEERPYRSPM
jgi:Flp pilus assembly protein TadD